MEKEREKAAKEAWQVRRRQLVDELFALGNLPPDQRALAVERRIAELVSAIDASDSSQPPRKRKRRWRKKRLPKSSPSRPVRARKSRTFSCVPLFWIMFGVYALPDVHKMFGADHV